MHLDTFEVVRDKDDDEGADGDEVAGEASRLGVRSVVVVGDLTDFDDCGEIVGSARDDLGPVDVFVNCVGIRPHQAVVDLTVEEWRRVIDTNCSSFLYLAKLLLPSMVDRGFGLAHRSDRRARRPGQDCARVGRGREIAPHEVVKCIAVETGHSGMTANVVSQAIGEPSHPGVLASDVLREPLAIPRPALLDEIASACAYLASPDGAYVTGHTLHVDSGYTI